MFRAGSYSLEELEALAEGYEELREIDNKAWVLVRLVDMWRAYDFLSREHQEAVLLVGMIGLSTRAAAPYLDVSHTTVAKRYNRAVDAMQSYLNGES